MDTVKSFTLSQMILCEGPEDVCFFQAMIEERGLAHFHVEHTGRTRRDRGGNGRFGEKLRALRLNRTFKNVKKILIVTDSDEDSKFAFENVRRQVADAGFAAPANTQDVGVGDPLIRIVTIPHLGCGNLETCLLEAARTASGAIADFSDEFVEKVASDDNWTQPKKDKLLLRLIISSQHHRDPAINLAPLFSGRDTRRMIPLEHQSLNWIRDLLNGL